MLTWVECLDCLVELKEVKQRQLQQNEPNEHERHLRDTGGIGNFRFYYPDPYTDRLLDFTEHLKTKYNEKDGA